MSGKSALYCRKCNVDRRRYRTSCARRTGPPPRRSSCHAPCGPPVTLQSCCSARSSTARSDPPPPAAASHHSRAHTRLRSSCTAQAIARTLLRQSSFIPQIDNRYTYGYSLTEHYGTYLYRYLQVGPYPYIRCRNITSSCHLAPPTARGRHSADSRYGLLRARPFDAQAPGL